MFFASYSGIRKKIGEIAIEPDFPHVSDPYCTIVVLAGEYVPYSAVSSLKIHHF
jgi:hypothetical protein